MSDVDTISARELALSVYDWLKELGLGQVCPHEWVILRQEPGRTVKRCAICKLHRIEASGGKRA